MRRHRGVLRGRVPALRLVPAYRHARPDPGEGCTRARAHARTRSTPTLPGWAHAAPMQSPWQVLATRCAGRPARGPASRSCPMASVGCVCTALAALRRVAARCTPWPCRPAHSLQASPSALAFALWTGATAARGGTLATAGAGARLALRGGERGAARRGVAWRGSGKSVTVVSCGLVGAAVGCVARVVRGPCLAPGTLSLSCARLVCVGRVPRFGVWNWLQLQHTISPSARRGMHGHHGGVCGPKYPARSANMHVHVSDYTVKGA